jgi:hypothetical protein
MKYDIRSPLKYENTIISSKLDKIIRLNLGLDKFLDYLYLDKCWLPQLCIKY